MSTGWPLSMNYHQPNKSRIELFEIQGARFQRNLRDLGG
jgi:hypothetical protein